MSFWKIIKGIRFRQLFSLIRFTLKHPIFMLATAKATKNTLKTVQQKFPDIHGKDNKANAFRHALWNYMIAFYSSKYESNKELVSAWVKKITDWHEEFSPNKGLARAMDFHNNYIGRMLFLKNEVLTEKEAIKELEKLLDKAVKVSSIEIMNKNKKSLVYIEDY